jgi:hypothetical protein
MDGFIALVIDLVRKNGLGQQSFGTYWSSTSGVLSWRLS